MKKMILNSSFVKNLKQTPNFEDYPYQLTEEQQNQFNVMDLVEHYNHNSQYNNARNIILIRKSELYQYEIISLYHPNGIAYFFATANMIYQAIMEHNSVPVTINFSNTISSITVYSPSLSELFLNNYCFVIIWNSFLSFGGYILIQPLKERIYNVKHMLYLSGANMFFYWFAMTLVDFVKYLIFFVIIFLIKVDFKYMLLLYIPFSIVYIFVSYLFSFFINKKENYQKHFILFILFFTIILPIITFLRLYYNYKEDFPTKIKEYLMSNTFLFTECDLFPITSLMIATSRILVGLSKEEDCSSLYGIIINYIIIFACQGIVLILLLYLLEKRIIEKTIHKCSQRIVKSNDSLLESHYNRPLLSDNQTENHNVNYLEEEINKIKNKRGKLTTIIQNLKKTYWVCCGKNVHAINRLYLGLEANEKFGLLGFNGSGKTTTFKSITNQIFFEEGTIELHGLNTKTDFDTIRQFVGYCPQENALFNHLNVYDTIDFYRSLKGVNESVEDICNRYGLGKYIYTISKKLSGGNKRKLIFAIALMNNPRILLLDEPSTGVDPESRRIMWKNINLLESTNNNYNMILTTHSMEEAEILCDTVSWLKNGNFVCIGNPEKLKLMFSGGYHIHIKFNNDDNIMLKEGNEISMLEELVNNGSLINKIIEKNPLSKEHFVMLFNTLGIIKNQCANIHLDEVGEDFSFELTIQINEEKQGEVFYKNLTLKNVFINVSEICINLKSLENILLSQENISNI